MNTTLESTSLDDQNRARREGSVLWSRTKALLDELEDARVELQRLQAQPARQTQAMRQVKVNAAQAKDQSVLAAIAMVLTTKRKTLMHEKGWRDRTHFIQTQLEQTPTAYGLPADYAHTARERDIRLIRAALHVWEKINGCYHKSVPLS